MRFQMVLVSFVVALGLAPVAAQEYSAQQVVDFFSKQIQEVKTRGVCVGTVEECDKKNKLPGFDAMVTFDVNSATLTQAATDSLTQLSSALNSEQLSSAKFVVEGHTDASGTETYNDKLSDERAASVVAFLTAHGVANDRMTALGLGETAPRVPNPYDPSNRRVEMRLNLTTN